MAARSPLEKLLDLVGSRSSYGRPSIRGLILRAAQMGVSLTKKVDPNLLDIAVGGLGIQKRSILHDLLPSKDRDENVPLWPGAVLRGEYLDFAEDAPKVGLIRVCAVLGLEGPLEALLEILFDEGTGLEEADEPDGPFTYSDVVKGASRSTLLLVLRTVEHQTAEGVEKTLRIADILLKAGACMGAAEYEAIMRAQVTFARACRLAACVMMHEWVPEGRVRSQGHKVAAELRKAGLPAKFVPDSAGGEFKVLRGKARLSTEMLISLDRAQDEGGVLASSHDPEELKRLIMGHLKSHYYDYNEDYVASLIDGYGACLDISLSMLRDLIEQRRFQTLQAIVVGGHAPKVYVQMVRRYVRRMATETRESLCSRNPPIFGRERYRKYVDEWGGIGYDSDDDPSEVLSNSKWWIDAALDAFKGAEVPTTEELNALDSDGLPPLAHAQCGDDVRCLAEMGADPKLVFQGNTVLHRWWVSSNRDYDSIVPALVEVGADPNALNAAGQTPLFTQIMTSNNEYATRCIVRELLKAGADPNRYTDVTTSPMCAALSQHRMEVVRLLLDHGAEVPKGCEERLLWLASREGVVRKNDTSSGFCRAMRRLLPGRPATAATDLCLRACSRDGRWEIIREGYLTWNYLGNREDRRRMHKRLLGQLRMGTKGGRLPLPARSILVEMLDDPWDGRPQVW